MYLYVRRAETRTFPLPNTASSFEKVGQNKVFFFDRLPAILDPITPRSCFSFSSSLIASGSRPVTYPSKVF